MRAARSEENWLLKGDRQTVWKNLFTVGRKSTINFLQSFYKG
jgi:hypothetical protein